MRQDKMKERENGRKTGKGKMIGRKLSRNRHCVERKLEEETIHCLEPKQKREINRKR
jgi:hypothetical protein